MEIILREDIQGLGYRYDVVKVKDGFGRNFLIPQGMAIVASKSNRKMIDENIRQAAHKAEKLRQDAQSIADSIGDIVLEIRTKAGESGKIFGAITSLQICDALKDRGYDIEKKRISFKEKIKTLGTYHVVLDLHKEVNHEVAVNVVEE
ncbi:MAG: 50S ribosomal protein L9 [Bacteroidetes bacterium]|nr:50S ribosomal protein L9 [Bacteroidota bacterium]MDA1122430.1 50S ribosomal protein L9 [Bacteroidota bacterium]